RMKCGARASSGDRQNPCKAGVHQSMRLLLLSQEPVETYRAFIFLFDQLDLLRASELLVASHPLQSITQRTGAECSDGNRIVTFRTFFGADFQSDYRVSA